MLQKIEINAQSVHQGLRLDKFISSKLNELNSPLSRNRIKELIEDGKLIDANNLIYKSCSFKIKGSEKFILSIPALVESKIEAKNIDFEIIFEDQNMLVINKPAGVITHPGNGNHNNTLVNGLLYKIKDGLSGINGIMRPGIVHRLDKDTSGLMVVAKNDLAHRELATQIKDRILKRNYLALCYGTIKPLSGVIENNIARCRNNRLKMAIVKNGGKVAKTNYKTLKIFYDGLISLVECNLDTGRTHQIRVHLNEIGHPIIGDQTYNSKRRYLKDVNENLRNIINNFSRQFLHSYKINFINPSNRENMEFKIDLPEDLKKLINDIEQRI